MLLLAPEPVVEPARAQNLAVKLASSPEEVEAAMRLRFEVFNLELRQGLSAAYTTGLDRDGYDEWCDHLIVKDLALDRVVGTYRLLRRSRAEQSLGFYSENEFDLENLKRLPGESLELGRSCVARSHRSFAVINLLWGAIAQYVARHRVGYAFGCGSLHGARPEDVAPAYAYLRARHWAPERYRVRPRASCRIELGDRAAAPAEERRAARLLSPVMKGYLRAGAMICGEPAYDAEFGTADVLVLIETGRLAGRYRHHYLEERAGG